MTSVTSEDRPQVREAIGQAELTPFPATTVGISVTQGTRDNEKGPIPYQS